MRLIQLKDVLFPVEEQPIFVGLKDESSSRLLKVQDKKALVNGVTCHVLGIVGREYRLVTNEQALAWAYECCRSVFPDTTTAEWDVDATDGPATGRYCRIDLVHRTAKLDFGDVDAGQRPDAFGPFIRVTNSYTPFARWRSTSASTGRCAATASSPQKPSCDSRSLINGGIWRPAFASKSPATDSRHCKPGCQDSLQH